MSAPQHTGSPVDPRSARIGQVLDGRWQLEHLLGAGASAEVYEAKHRNGNRVAVKILHEGLAEHAIACNRLPCRRVRCPTVASSVTVRWVLTRSQTYFEGTGSRTRADAFGTRSPRLPQR